MPLLPYQSAAQRFVNFNYFAGFGLRRVVKFLHIEKKMYFVGDRLLQESTRARCSILL